MEEISEIKRNWIVRVYSPKDKLLDEMILQDRRELDAFNDAKTEVARAYPKCEWTLTPE